MSEPWWGVMVALGVLVALTRMAAGDGAEDWRETVAVGGLDAPSCTAMDDVDGDGRADLVVGTMTDRKIAWYPHLGAGLYGSQHLAWLGASPITFLAVGDLDGDGAPDIVFADESAAGLRWLRNGRATGEPFSAKAASLPISIVPETVNALLLVDLDMDGALDVVGSTTLDGAGGERVLSWHRNRGNGTWHAPIILAQNAADPYFHLSTVDLYGDGHLALLHIRSSVTTMIPSFYPNGTHSPPRAVATAGCSPFNFAAGDIDDDDRADLAVACPSEGIMGWLKNAGDGTFDSLAVIGSAIAGINWVVLGDLNGDGQLDLAAVATAAPITLLWVRNRLHTASQRFGSPSPLTFPGSGIAGIHLYDLNEDALLDVLVIMKSGDRIGWLANTGGGVFPTEATPLVSTVKNPTVALPVDMDGDSLLDLLCVFNQGNAISWFRGDGTGQFGLEISLTTAVESISSITVADLDGDSLPDLAAVSAMQGSLMWLRNEGAGAFAQPTVIANDLDQPFVVLAADINGDGALDLVSGSSGASTVFWSRNLGNGAFATTAILLANISGPYALAFSELDGDGRRDLVVSSFFQAAVYWYPQIRPGTYRPQSLVGSGLEGAIDLAVADLDGDGWTDVVSAASEDNSVFWHQNLQGQGFANPKLVSNDTLGVWRVAAGDLDGDGQPDIVAGSSTDNTVAWFPNLGNPTSFGGKTTLISSAMDLRDMRLADLDGDGDQDVIVASFADHLVRVLMNPRYTAPVWDQPVGLADIVTVQNRVQAAIMFNESAVLLASVPDVAQPTAGTLRVLTQGPTGAWNFDRFLASPRYGSGYLVRQLLAAEFGFVVVEAPASDADGTQLLFYAHNELEPRAALTLRPGARGEHVTVAGQTLHYFQGRVGSEVVAPVCSMPLPAELPATFTTWSSENAACFPVAVSTTIIVQAGEQLLAGGTGIYSLHIDGSPFGALRTVLSSSDAERMTFCPVAAVTTTGRQIFTLILDNQLYLGVWAVAYTQGLYLQSMHAMANCTEPRAMHLLNDATLMLTCVDPSFLHVVVMHIETGLATWVYSELLPVPLDPAAGRLVPRGNATSATSFFMLGGTGLVHLDMVRFVDHDTGTPLWDATTLVKPFISTVEFYLIVFSGVLPTAPPRIETTMASTLPFTVDSTTSQHQTRAPTEIASTTLAPQPAGSAESNGGNAIVAGVVAGVAAVLVVAIGVVAWHRRRQRKPLPNGALGIGDIVPMSSAEQIELCLLQFTDQLRSPGWRGGRGPQPLNMASQKWLQDLGPLGKGNFGVVRKAKPIRHTEKFGDQLVVAVKQFESIQAADYKAVMMEAALMHTAGRHPHIVQLLAVVQDRWMAPEALLRAQFSPASDVWSLGIVIWEGRTPFGERTMQMMLELLQAGKRLDTQHIPSALHALLSATWEAKAELRPSAQAVAQALQEQHAPMAGFADNRGLLALEEPTVLEEAESVL
ncbi:uncharacterized protein MONBRDRAFT_39187 [Monosiga brevicollis MX1]|uniref:Protein kinase domain-containing protein n=1 Tax=Monosiga brevicollis TaxID=81824 RepID=A9VCR7_MONBE|nr:uncharacterized protein MONBRDRAFT_39187 [Monosiga brevicollis MX1]EDQ84696.1 predicted protein [Monosiga brevicollis MX1]|eukprot:XP_001750482.1 hypothetical protein [Monosiga brevicollis MX1]